MQSTKQSGHGKNNAHNKDSTKSFWTYAFHETNGLFNKVISKDVRNWFDKTRCPDCEFECGCEACVDHIDFKQPYQKNASLVIERTKETRVSLPGKPWCGWSTMYDDTIAVGRMTSATVDIVNTSGAVTSHELPIGGYVKSGLYIDKEKCMINVKNPDRVFTCNINPFDEFPSKPHILTELPVKNPIHVFPYIKCRYGVLSRKPSKIEIFCKRAVIYTNEERKHRQTLTLDLPNLSDYDRACCLPDGRLCVSSSPNHLVYIFDKKGTLTKTIGRKCDPYTDIVVPGGLYVPCSIEATESGTLVITDYCGFVHAYNESNGWDIVKRRDYGFTCASVLTDTRLWRVGFSENSVEVYKIIN